MCRRAQRSLCRGWRARVVFATSGSVREVVVHRSRCWQHAAQNMQFVPTQPCVRIHRCCSAEILCTGTLAHRHICCSDRHQSLSAIAVKCASTWSSVSFLNLPVPSTTATSTSCGLKSADSTCAPYTSVQPFQTALHADAGRTVCRHSMASWTVAVVSRLVSSPSLNCFSKKLLASCSFTPAAVAL